MASGDVVRIQFDRLQELGDGQVLPPVAHVAVAQAVVGVPGAGIGLDVQLEDLDGVLRPALVDEVQAELVQPAFGEVVGVGRIRLQAPIKPDRFTDVPVVEDLVQDRLDGRLGRLGILESGARTGNDGAGGRPQEDRSQGKKDDLAEGARTLHGFPSPVHGRACPGKESRITVALRRIFRLH